MARSAMKPKALTRDFLAFQGFEEAIAVEKRNGTERRHKLLLDVCATDADGAGVGGLGGWLVGTGNDDTCM